MVPYVEGLEAQLEAAATRFAEREALEERQVPVVTTRSTNGVVAEIAPSAESGCIKDRRINILNLLISGHDRVDVRDLANQVRTVARIRQAVIGLFSAHMDIDGNSRLHSNDAGNLPTTEG